MSELAHQLAAFGRLELAIGFIVLLALLVIDARHRAWYERTLRKQGAHRRRYLRSLRAENAETRRLNEELRELLEESVELRGTDPQPPTAH